MKEFGWKILNSLLAKALLILIKKYCNGKIYITHFPGHWKKLSVYLGLLWDRKLGSTMYGIWRKELPMTMQNLDLYSKNMERSLCKLSWK